MVFLVSYDTYVHVLAAQLQMNLKYSVTRSSIAELWQFERWSVCMLRVWDLCLYFVIRKE